MSLEELSKFGMVEMDESEIRSFLLNQGVGVLGLPGEDVPYMVPMSFGFDGESNIYFTYVLGSNSQKENLTDKTEKARFLVYSAESMYIWESVLLTGKITEVPVEEWGKYKEVMERAWRPALFQEADLDRGVKVYRFEIKDQRGIKHNGLPPGFETGNSE